MNTKLTEMQWRAKYLKPKVSWIPRSEQEYLQQQKLLPVFQWWLNQIWEAQEKELNSLITEVWNEAIKECEGCVEDYGKQISELHSEMIGNAHEDSKMMLAFDMHSRLIAVKHITEKIKALLPRTDITSDK